MKSQDEELLYINVAEMFEDNNPAGCGYCKHQTMKKSLNRHQFKFSVNSIPVIIMQNLMTKGWGKSGNIIYKYTYEKTCCKLYQPRVDINKFQISKEQKKVMKRFRKYLSGEYETNKLNNLINSIKEINNYNNNIFKEKEEDLVQKNIEDKLNEYLVSVNFLNILNKYIQNGNDIDEIYIKICSSKVRKNNNKKFDYDYSCDLIFIIKNMLINLRKKNGMNINNKDIEQSMEFINFVNEIYNDFVNYYKPDPKNEIISLNNNTGHINFKINNNINKINNNNNQIKENNNKINLKANNNNIINNEKQKYIFDYFKEIVPEPEIYLPLKHIYTLELTDKISLTDTDERFLLYLKYEKEVHKDSATPQSYNRFIGCSPLIKKKINKPQDFYLKTKHPELYPDYYGTYNLIHRLDGKIVAVTVIDILPNYLSSLYCYYDPDFSFLDLGVVTAIREIEYMKSFQELIDKNFTYYTMGEMSQSVTKLKYKGNYCPTEIMDHYTGIYVPLTDQVKALIADNECHCLNMYGYNLQNEDKFPKNEIDLYIENVYVNVFGEQILFMDFVNLYFTEDNLRVKTLLPYLMKRFMEIIDIDTFFKIRFYYDPNELK